MTPKREPVVLPMSILAGLYVLTGGIGGISYFSNNPLVGAFAALGVLVIAAAQTGIMYWVRGQVTPVEDAAGRRAELTAPEDVL